MSGWLNRAGSLAVLAAAVVLLLAGLPPAAAHDGHGPGDGSAAGAIDGGIRLAQSRSQSQAGMRIDITARRFEFSPGVIRVPAGTPVELHIVSEDVAHGFAVRELGIDERVEPGEETVIRFTAPRAGRYAIGCSVFCGAGHGSMDGELVVE